MMLPKWIDIDENTSHLIEDSMIVGEIIVHGPHWKAYYNGEQVSTLAVSKFDAQLAVAHARVRAKLPGRVLIGEEGIKKSRGRMGR